MSFLSRFPFFDKDEIAPNEINVQENVDVNFGRVISRLSLFAPLLNRFLFGRSDGGGRLFISNGFWDNPNAITRSVVTNGAGQDILPQRSNRQYATIYNNNCPSITVFCNLGNNQVFETTLLVDDTLILDAFTGTVTIISSNAGSTITVFEA